MAGAQDLLREVVALNKRRTSEGIAPVEYQRWLDLSAQLKKQFPGHPPLGGRGETKIRVEFQDYAALMDAAMYNIQPIGIFLNTPFAAEVGVKFGLVVFVKQSGKTYWGRVAVVSNNIGPDFSTIHLGMGMKFVEQKCDLRALLERLHAEQSEAS